MKTVDWKLSEGELMDIPELKRLERREFDMALTWSNGTEHQITYDDLRHACPCARCSPLRNEEKTSMSLRRDIERLHTEKPSIKPVGKYALAFKWAHGCSAGLYRYERIWRLGEKLDPDNGQTYVHGAW
tara:strand:- start:2051 stop:2437 length:387 start_codon:yes stop_codon:yes gene_type:complete